MTGIILTPLRGESKEQGTLTPADISDMDLHAVKLLFLAGCATGTGTLSNEGVVNLSRSFLESGVQCVVLTSTSQHE